MALVGNLKQQKWGTRLHKKLKGVTRGLLCCSTNCTLLLQKGKSLLFATRSVYLCNTYRTNWKGSEKVKNYKTTEQVWFSFRYCKLVFGAASQGLPRPLHMPHYRLMRGRPWQKGPITPCTAVLPIHTVLSANRQPNHKSQSLKVIFLASFPYADFKHGEHYSAGVSWGD